MKIINGKDLINMEFIETEDGLLKRYEKKGKFIPEIGQKYYYVNSRGVVICARNDEDEDKWAIAHNPIFETREECEEYKKYLIALDEYSYEFSEEEWKDENIKKCWLFFNFNNNEIGYNSNCYLKSRKTHFKSREVAENFINEVGKENIKKFMFGVYE